jgi:hypothetical protein
MLDKPPLDELAWTAAHECDVNAATNLLLNEELRSSLPGYEAGACARVREVPAKAERRCPQMNRQAGK